MEQGLIRASMAQQFSADYYEKHYADAFERQTKINFAAFKAKVIMKATRHHVEETELSKRFSS